MDWVESVDEGYAIVKNMCERVVVGGFSTGAGLALDLAARVKDLAGIIAVFPPLKLQDFSTKFVLAMDVWTDGLIWCAWLWPKKNLLKTVRKIRISTIFVTLLAV